VFKRSSIWIYASILHFINDFITTLIPAIILILRSEFSLSYADQGLLMTIPTLISIIPQTFTGHLADRVHVSRVMLVCAMLLGFGTALMGLSQNFNQLLISACIVGLGASFTHPTIYSITSSHYAGLEGRYLSFVSAAGDISLPMVFAVTEALTGMISWRIIMICYGLTAISISIILYKASSNININRRVSGKTISSYKLIKQLIKPLIVLGIITSCYRIILTFTTTYLNHMGLSIEWSNYIFALILAISIMGPVMTGILLKGGGGMRIVALEMTIISILSITLTASSNTALTTIILVPIGILILSVWPPVYSTISRSSPQEHMGLTYGASLTFTWAFGSIWPYIAGIIADNYGINMIYPLVAALSLVAVAIAITYGDRAPSETLPMQ
jgi:FSR family fosmidomycin resistance protein-like MFS transporter